MGKSFFITFEGGEGVGKSTQIKILSDYLEKKMYKNIITREPGGTENAELIRNIVLKGKVDSWDATSEALLMFAARRDHFIRKIKPNLDNGISVLCDRFADSTMAYQGIAYGKTGLGVKKVEDLYKIVLGNFTPHLTFIMDLSVEESLHRIKKRDIDSINRYECMDIEFHKKLRLAFLDIAKNNKERCVVIDASKSIDDIHNEICNIIELKLLSK
ncbi:MAG: dTMP kinase [Alphaproteobacteria bacterium]|nr:dTMP kinase [Alphaproteobacteria bacterium]